MSTKPKFTPGPWNVREQGEKYGTKAPLVVLNNACTCAVAEIYSTDRLKNSESNARLIAAAPEMYEALNSALQSLAYAAEVLEAPKQSTMREKVETIRTLLSKINGGES